MLSISVKKHLLKLQQKKYREEFKEFFVEGIKGVEEALSEKVEIILIIIQGDRREEPEFAKIIALAEKNKIPLEYCGRKDLDEIKTTYTFPGILAVVNMPDFGLDDLIDGPIIALDQINDPGNLGTIIRTADWFGIKNILLSEGSVEPYNPKVVRSTMGSIFRVKIFTSSNIEQNLISLKKDYGYKICSLTMNGEDLNKSKLLTGKIVYLFGSESHGVRQELEKIVDKSYTIKGKGMAESLNVAMAAGILMNKIFIK